MPMSKRTTKKTAERTKDTAIAELADHGLTPKQEKFCPARRHVTRVLRSACRDVTRVRFRGRADIQEMGHRRYVPVADLLRCNWSVDGFLRGNEIRIKRPSKPE
jgi:hypothetical protein